MTLMYHTSNSNHIVQVVEIVPYPMLYKLLNFKSQNINVLEVKKFVRLYSCWNEVRNPNS